MAILPGCSVTRDWFYDRRYKTGKIPGPYTGISMARNSIYKYRGYQPNDSRLVPPLIIRDVVPFLFPSPYSLLIPSSSFFYFHHEWTSDEIRSNHSILEIQNPLFHSSQFFDYQLKKNWSTCKFFEILNSQKSCRESASKSKNRENPSILFHRCHNTYLDNWNRI